MAMLAKGMPASDPGISSRVPYLMFHVHNWRQNERNGILIEVRITLQLDDCPEFLYRTFRAVL